MNVQDLVFITQTYEKILTGNTNCGIINKAYKLINPKDNLKSKKQKIKAIKTWWENLADNTIATMVINKQKSQNNE